MKSCTDKQVGLFYHRKNTYQYKLNWLVTTDVMDSW